MPGRGKAVSKSEIQEVLGLLASGKSPLAVAREKGLSRSEGYKIRRRSLPRLKLGIPSVDLWMDRDRLGRYVTIVVSVDSEVEARDCWGWLDVVAPLGPSFPLHWAGHLLTPEEFSSPRTDIRPRTPARLDVAFALPPPGYESKREKVRSALSSGQITAIGSSTIPLEWQGEGCWAAQPAALFRPDPLSAAYLRPGEYRVRVTVGCSGGQGDSSEFRLVSAQSWEGLKIQPL